MQRLPLAEEMIWSKQDEVNLKDQREYTIVIGRPGVFKLILKRNEKGLSLGIKRPVCLVKLVKGQDAKNGPVLEQQYEFLSLVTVIARLSVYIGLGITTAPI